MTRPLVYKIVSSEAWAAAVSLGKFPGSAVDRADGFVHFSTAAQVRETASRHFARQTGLLLIAFDAGALGPELKWEKSRDGDLFPHLYASLDPALAVAADPLPVDAAGRHIFPAGIP
jgi:uncharacterized protein (DUF952 family)